MTLPRLEGLNRAWKKNPPVHLAVARYLDWGKGSSGSDPSDNELEQRLLGAPAIGVKPNGR